MTREDKHLLLITLCGMLPYGLFCKTDKGDGKLISIECSAGEVLAYVDFGYPQAEEYDLNDGDTVKPYLRPMSSMTEEERREYDKLIAKCIYDPEAYFFDNYDRLYDWLNSHHFDYRGLIEKSLAIVAPEDMYK